MTQLTPEQAKSYTKISEQLGLSEREVQRAVNLYWRGVQAVIQNDEAVEIIIPYFGKIYPSRKTVRQISKQLNEKNEVSNFSE